MGNSSFNFGGFSIGIPPEKYKMTFLIVFLISIAIDIKIFPGFESKDIKNWIVFGISIIVELMMLYLIVVTKPKYLSFLKCLRKTIIKSVTEFNKNPTGQHIEKGERVPSTIDWPPKNNERIGTVYHFVEHFEHLNIYDFIPILEMINRNGEVYEFIKSNSEQYNFPIAVFKNNQAFNDKKVTRDAITALINISLDYK